MLFYPSRCLSSYRAASALWERVCGRSVSSGSLRDQYELAAGLAAFEVTVGLIRLGKVVGSADTDAQVVLTDPGEDALRPPGELLAGRGVVADGGPGEVETALLVEDLGVQGLHGAACLA